MEQLDYNILFRWFVGLAMDEPIWVTTVFTKNRDRLLNQDLARDFLRRSQHARPRIEPAFGWLKTIGWLRKVKLRGLSKVHWLVCLQRPLSTSAASPR